MDWSHAVRAQFTNLQVQEFNNFVVGSKAAEFYIRYPAP